MNNFALGDRVRLTRAVVYAYESFPAGAEGTVQRYKPRHGGAPATVSVRFDAQQLPGAVYRVQTSAVVRENAP